jgi:hypothetical protein
MSPDERPVADVIARAVARARVLAVAYQLAWALGVGAVAAEIATLARMPRLATTLTAAVAAFLLGLRRRMQSRAAVLARLEHAEPRSRNLLVTADELRDREDIKPAVRARVLADASAVASRIELARALPAAAARRAAIVAAAMWTVVGVTTLTVDRRIDGQSRPAAQDRSADAVPPGSMRITATIEPPRYTGQPSATIVDPAEVRAVEGSRLILRIDGPTSRVTVTGAGGAHAVEPDASGVFLEQETLTRTGYVVVDAPPAVRRTLPVVVTSDALPSVRLTAPGRDLVLAGGNPRLEFEARASDDFGLRSLALQYTKVSGSGEQFEFKEGQIPLAIDRASDRDWRGKAERFLADLDLKEGDMLVYRAVASDARPGDGSASSDAFFIERSTLGASAAEAFTLPQEETRYALSEQMLIVKTERLAGRRGSMTAEEFRDASINLGVEQRMIRAEFVFMLGGEVEDEEVEAEQSTELQEGRLRNRGQADLRSATVTMSQAEKYLTGANTADALTAERAAVNALQRAFARDRYILRALAVRGQLDLSRRLTGDLSRASDWRRRVADRPENRLAAQLQELLRGIAALAADAGIDQASARPRASVLAEQALRADPSSAALRDGAMALQKLADAWPSTDRPHRSSRLGEIAAVVAAEARRTLAAASPIDRPAPNLAGRFADALRPTKGAR